MKPDFALLLSFDGIALLRRASAYGGSPDGWYRLDKVAPTAPDLPAALKAMRAVATEVTGGTDPEVKLVLPTEQVKFLDVSAPDRGISVAETVEAALDGATPYAIDELVYDFHVEGDEVHIAAVARETLEEAESFAIDNGFLPLGFVSDVSDGAGFKREPFFGPTQKALTTLTPGLTVQGDDLPIKVLDGAPPAAADDAVPEFQPDSQAVAEDEPKDPVVKSDAPKAAPPAPAAADDTAKGPDAAEGSGAAETTSAKPPAPDADISQGKDDTPPTAVSEPTKDDASADATAPRDDARADKTPASEPRTEPSAAAAASKPDDRNPEARPILKAPTSQPDLKAPKTAPSPPKTPAPVTTPRSAEAAKAPASSPALAPRPSKEAPSETPGFASIRARRDAPVPPAASAPGKGKAVSPPATPASPQPRIQGNLRPGGAASGPANTPSPVAESDINNQIAAKARDSFTKRPKNKDLSVSTEATDAKPAGTDGTPSAKLSATPGAMVPPAKSVGFASRRNGSAKSGKSGKPVTAPAQGRRKPETDHKARVSKAVMATGAALEESERMTVFGARNKQKVGGKPRYLGVLLTAALVLVMLAVAAWATLVMDDGFAGLIRRDTQTPVVASAVVADPTEADTEQPALSEPASGAQNPPRARPVPDTALALPDTAGEVDADDASAIDVAALSQGVPALSRDLVEDQVDGLSVPFEAETLTPEQAEARYAATGIWQRSPVPPAELGENPVGDVYVASIDPGVDVGDAVAIPSLRDATTDVPPGAQSNPYPPDAGLTFDENGLIKATPEGVEHPDGFRLVLGPPPVKPPPRPGATLPQPAVQPAPETSPEEETEAPELVTAPGAALAPDGSATPAPAAPEVASEPQSGTTGTTAPEGDSRDVAAALAPLIEALQTETETETQDTPEPTAPVVTDPTLAGLRPTPRPGDLVEQNERANLGGISLEELRQKRPLPRPDEDAAKTEAEQQIEASALAVAASVQPKTRPANIAALVTRATREQQQQQQAAPVATASSAGTVAPRTVTPSIPSRSSVAAAATEKNAINLRRVNLIGVYGKPSSRRALVRLANGSYKKVKVGDRIDGGRVSSIGDGQLSYVKSGRSIVLRMPRS